MMFCVGECRDDTILKLNEYFLIRFIWLWWNLLLSYNLYRCFFSKEGEGLPQKRCVSRFLFVFFSVRFYQHFIKMEKKNGFGSSKKKREYNFVKLIYCYQIKNFQKKMYTKWSYQLCQNHENHLINAYITVSILPF